jgi:hypothetical protein
MRHLPLIIVKNGDSCRGVFVRMKYSIASRPQILTLLAIGFNYGQISDRTGVARNTQKNIWDKAISRGFDPYAQPLLILDIYVEDGKRSGRPPKKDDEKDEVLELVGVDRNGRELSCEEIADRLGNRICAKTVWTILHEAGLSKTKPTRKPGLTEKMRKARLEWCLAYQHWTLEDWKHVIWSDETSVVLCVRRGGYQV